MIKSIEIRAEEILNKLGISSIPVPIEEISNKFKILIRKASSNEFSGLLFRKEDSDISYIAISSKESPVRQRFTIAHELGHYFLHPQKKTFIEFRDNQKNIIRGQKEIEANRFAAAILMPKKFLIRDVQAFKLGGISTEHVKFLAQKYKVSEDAMNYRLINLHLLS